MKLLSLLVFNLYIGQMLGIHNFEQESDLEIMKYHFLYYSFNDILHAQQNQVPRIRIVRKLLNTVEVRCQEVFNKHQDDVTKQPFIIIECRDRKLRDFVTVHVANWLGAKIQTNPPIYMKTSKTNFPNKQFARRLYFLAGNYASACEAKEVSSRQIVLIQGHFIYQAAFAISSTFGKSLPNPDSELYYWPEDMVKPDYVLFINNQINPANGSLADLTNTIFRLWRDPEVIEVDASGPRKLTVEEIIKIINNRLELKNTESTMATNVECK